MGMISLYELPALQFVRGLIWTFLVVTPQWDDQTIMVGSWSGGCTLFRRAPEFLVADSKFDHAHRGRAAHLLGTASSLHFLLVGWWWLCYLDGLTLELSSQT